MSIEMLIHIINIGALQILIVNPSLFTWGTYSGISWVGIIDFRLAVSSLKFIEMI